MSRTAHATASEMVRLTTWLTEEERRLIEYEARRLGVSLNSVVRRALRREFGLPVVRQSSDDA